jgi:polyribonucleotide nucleotidyltransferase
MVEAGSTEVSEAEMLEAIMRGHDAIKAIVAVQVELSNELGKTRRTVPAAVEPEGVREKVTAAWKAPLADAMRIKGKLESYARWMS